MELEPSSVDNEHHNLVTIFKKRRRTNKWDKVMVTLKGTSLIYRSHELSEKEIELSGSIVYDVDDIEGRPYSFSIKPHKSSRIYLFSTSSEEEKLKLLNAVCDLQMTKSKRKDDSAACMIS